MAVQLLYRQTYNKRPVVMYSIGSNICCAYQSLSEGLWRFAAMISPELSGRLTIRGNPGDFVKGKNYISTTQLHMDLQRHISENYSTLSVGNIDDFTTIWTLTSASPNCDAIIDMLEGKGREYNHDVFYPLDLFCNIGNDHCFGDPSKFDAILKTVKSRGTGCMNYATCGLLRTTKYYDRLISLYTQIYENKERDRDAPNSQIIARIEAISEYMSTYFNYSEPERPFTLNTTSAINGRPITLTVYKTVLTFKGDGSMFDMYYAKYNYAGNPYKIILSLTPQNTTMDEFGVNRQYISSGIYTYKMFDYIPIKPRSPREIPATLQPVYISEDYQFVGDMLTNMWPLSIIDNPSIFKKGGRRRRTNCRTTKLRRLSRKRR